jgi:hypothetical protein
MQDSGNKAWLVARFPSRGLRQEFLDRVKLLNGFEDLTPIETKPLADGTRLRFWSADERHRNLWRLVDSFGGRFAGVFYNSN